MFLKKKISIYKTSGVSELYLGVTASVCPQTSVPCVDSVVLDVDRLGASQAPGNQRSLLSDSNQPSISLEPLSPTHSEATPRTPADITIAVTSK